MHLVECHLHPRFPVVGLRQSEANRLTGGGSSTCVLVTTPNMCGMIHYLEIIVLTAEENDAEMLHFLV